MLRPARLALIALAFSAGVSLAEDLTVPAGRKSYLFDFSNTDENCQSIGRSKGSVVTEPKHGKVSFEWVSARLGEGTRFCKGKFAKVLRIAYTPDRGYRGPDHFRVGISMARYADISGNSFSTEHVDLVVK